MTRGARVRRGVVVLSVVVAAAAGCTGGRPAAERVSHAAQPAGRSTVAVATSTTGAGPTRTTKVRNFPVGSWCRLPLSAPVRLEIPATRVADGPGTGASR